MTLEMTVTYECYIWKEKVATYFRVSWKTENSREEVYSGSTPHSNPRRKTSLRMGEKRVTVNKSKHFSEATG
jgi:hypothetical protein